MRRLARHVFTILAALSLLLCIAVCGLWVWNRIGYANAEWTYNRWLPDRSAASNAVYLTTDKRRLRLLILWGRVGPSNGNLVWGYQINADQSGGRPRFKFDHGGYDPSPPSWPLAYDPDTGATGWGPLRWRTHSRSNAAAGERSRSIHIGVSHWLAALLLLVLPALWLKRFHDARRARNVGLCPTCGYDLRASPERCPECGTIALF